MADLHALRAVEGANPIWSSDLLKNVVGKHVISQDGCLKDRKFSNGDWLQDELYLYLQPPCTMLMRVLVVIIVRTKTPQKLSPSGVGRHSPATHAGAMQQDIARLAAQVYQCVLGTATDCLVGKWGTDHFGDLFL